MAQILLIGASHRFGNENDYIAVYDDAQVLGVKEQQCITDGIFKLFKTTDTVQETKDKLNAARPKLKEYNDKAIWYDTDDSTWKELNTRPAFTMSYNGSDFVHNLKITANNTPVTIYGWFLNEKNTGLLGAGINPKDLTVLDLTDSEDPDYGKGTMNYAGVTGYLHFNNGVTISNRKIPFSYKMDGTNVTLENCWIQPTAVGAGLPMMDMTNPTITDCDIDGSILPTFSAGLGMTNGQALRCNIWGMSTGMQLYCTSGAMLVENCMVHDLRYVSPAHVDGITIRQNTGTSIEIRNCCSITDVIATGAMFIQPSTGAITSPVYINGCLFGGCGFNLQITGSTYSIDNSSSIFDNNLMWSDEVVFPAYNNWGEWSNISSSAIGTFTNMYKYDPLNPPTYRGDIITLLAVLSGR